MSKKEKLLASAQKNLLKGQVAKAIKDYEKVVETCPDDVRNRQKLGELYNRVGMMAEALETYESVARHYAKNGFYLKAIAVYKQMQKVDPSQTGVYYRLAELNEKQGLVGNAQAEYRHLIKLLRDQDKDQEVIKVLGKMQELDPDNIRLRLERMEMHARRQEGERVAEIFGQTLEHLQTKKDLACPPALRQALEHYCPGNVQLTVDLAKVLLDREDIASSTVLLKGVLAGDPENRPAVLLLAEAFHLDGEFEQERKNCEQFLRNHPEDLDVREKFVRACLACGDGPTAFEEIDGWKVSFLEDQRLPVLKGFYERLQELLPDNEAVHTTLRAVYEKTGEGGKLFDLMSSEEVQPGIGATGEEQAESEPPAGQEEPAYGELPEKPAAGFSEGPEVKDASDAGSTAGQAAGDDLEFEIELEISDPEVSLDTFEAHHLDFDNLNLEESPSEEPALDLDEIIGGLDDLDLGKVAAPPVDISGDLEEAEFYLQQGLLEEAEAKCRAVLEAAPGCNEARQLLDRIPSPGGTASPKPEAKAGKSREANQSADAGTKHDREKSRLDGSLSEFRKGLENQISAEDTETHYNLGIAYKEMGLFDDAVEQFEKAMLDPARVVDCLTLKGICQVQKGEYEKAVETLKSGLALGNLKEEERVSFHYELGVLYQSWDRPLEALESFQGVADAQPFFRDVEAKIKALRKELGLDDGGEENPGSGSARNRVSYI